MRLGMVLPLLCMIVLVKPGTSYKPGFSECRREIDRLSRHNRDLSSRLKRLEEKEKGCSYNGAMYTNEDIFYDDCNTCVCNYGTVACTNDTCNKDCAYSGELYADGSTFISESGCYTCTCINGCVDCSSKICLAHPLDKAYATQSSLNFQLRPASLAIDEKYHTAMSTSWPIPEEAKPEWTVELRCEQTIESVRLWRRKDGLLPNGMRDLVISVDGQYCGNVTTSPARGEDVLVTCDTPLTGRTVKVTKQENRTLSIAEVELVTVC